MKIVHLSNNDIGGAGIAAIRLHTSLLNNGISSTFLTKQKHHSSIPQHFQFNAVGQFINKVGVKIGLMKDDSKENALLHLANRPEGYEHFSFPFSEMDLTAHRLVSEADLIHLHWVSDGYLDFFSFFQKINKPVVWTLHDMNPFTGGCHHADECNGYKNSCNSCPQLRNTIDENYAAVILKLKSEALRAEVRNNLKIISPSEWLLNCSAQSKVFSGLQHFNIPNMADTKLFFPLDKNECRKKLGLPLEKKILLFVAKDVDNPRKGIKYLKDAVNLLSGDFLVCSVGKAGTVFPDAFNFDYVNNIQKLNEIYNAADVFVLPSLAENFPNTVCEALLCGTPVAAFNVGGIPELINEKNGRLAEYKNAGSLKKEIEFILSGNKLFDKNGIASVAKDKFNPDAIVNEHLKIYKSFKMN